jgi:hypothetical protein
MGRHDQLIDRLFADEQDRVLARAFAEKFADVPGMEDRIAPLLHEASRNAEQVGDGVMSPEAARAYLSDFASTALGTPAHVMEDLTTWFDSAASAETPPVPTSEPAQPAAVPTTVQPPQPTAAAPSRPATSTPTREALQQQIAQHQSNMRAPQNSPEWRAYWKEGGAADYARALQALEAAPEAAAPPTLAGGAAAPAQPAEPAPAA